MGHNFVIPFVGPYVFVSVWGYGTPQDSCDLPGVDDQQRMTTRKSTVGFAGKPGHKPTMTGDGQHTHQKWWDVPGLKPSNHGHSTTTLWIEPSRHIDEWSGETDLFMGLSLKPQPAKTTDDENLQPRLDYVNSLYPGTNKNINQP